MGAVSTPKSSPVPPEPETVKYTEQEVTAARASAKSAAARKKGVGGTNISKGVLTDDNIETKKKTLGGE